MAVSSADRPATGSARRQLVQLVARREPWRLTGVGPAPLVVEPGARAAAVLVLFGVLARRPAQHAAAAVAAELDVLLLCRATTLTHHPGQVSFPGGRQDPDDAGPEAAALREAVEETGLDPTGVEVLGVLDALPLPISRHLVTPVIAWWRTPSTVTAVDPGESTAVFRAPVADLLDPANRCTVTATRGRAVHKSPGFLPPPGTASTRTCMVWGFTAIVLDGIFDHLGWTEPWDRSVVFPAPAS